MYLITLRQMSNVDIPKIEYDRPLTFTKANDMLLEALLKYKQTGQAIKIKYKIIEIETKESIFNSKILINNDTVSLFQVIGETNLIPKQVIDYVKSVEAKSVEETDADISFNNHVEEKARLEELRSETTEIQQQLKNDDKERIQRDLEYQKKMKAIQEEKEALEKALQQKEKEEAFKESQRLEALRKLEEEKQEYQQRMEEKRAQDKRKKEEHEKRLKEVEEEAKKSEIELAKTEAELEKNVLERKIELQDVIDKKAAAERQATVLKAESEIEEVQHQQQLNSLTEVTEEHPIDLLPNHPSVAVASNQTAATVLPKLTLKERLRELDFEAVKNYSGQMIKFSAKASVKGSKRAYKLVKDHRTSRKLAKQEKQEQLSEKLATDEKLANVKMEFMNELKIDWKMQEREIKREANKKAKEAAKQVRIEERYRAEKKKKFTRSSINPFKGILSLLFIVCIAFGAIYYFDLGNGITVFESIKSFTGGTINNIKNLF